MLGSPTADVEKKILQNHLWLQREQGGKSVHQSFHFVLVLSVSLFNNTSVLHVKL